MALKPTSSVFTIGSSALEAVAGTFSENRIDLQLNPLDNEVLAIYAVDLQPSAPEMIGGTNTGTFAQLTRRSQTALVGIDDNDAIATVSRHPQRRTRRRRVHWVSLDGRHTLLLSNRRDCDRGNFGFVPRRSRRQQRWR